jgi:hypothetical protein
MGTTRSLLATSVLYLALATTPAFAATPFSAGTGFGHDLAVGGDGTGHVVFISDNEPADRVNYCRVPAGGSACDSESTVLDFPGPAPDAFSINSEAQIFTPAVNKVVILAPCFGCGIGGATDRIWRWISTDNGANFTQPAVEVGRNMGLIGQSAYLNTGEIALGVEGGLFQAMDNPPPSTVELSLGEGFPFVYSPAVVPVPGAAKAVHAVNDLGIVKYAVFTDPTPPGTTADEFNMIGNWDTGNFLPAPEAQNAETHLSSGANGVFLSYRFFSPNDNHLGLRKFDVATGTFGAPVYVEGSNPIDDNSLDYPHHSQDAGGRLHFVWRSLYDNGRLRYARSDDGGTSFTAAGTLAAQETVIDPIVEAASSGTGFAVWKGIGTTPIRVVVLDPQPESIPTGPDPNPPTITGFGIGDPTLTPGQSTTFSFTSSEAGTAVLTIEKKVKGLKLKKKKAAAAKLSCVPFTKKRFRKLRKSLAKKFSGKKLARKLKKRRCKTFKKVGEIKQAVGPGQNQIVFSGRIAGRKLSPGSYRAKLVVTDTSGNVSRTETLKFRVIRKRK